MKNKKLRKKIIILLIFIILIVAIVIINPIRLYNKHQLKNLGYNETSINTILDNKLKDKVIELEYNKTLDIILKEHFSFIEYLLCAVIRSFLIPTRMTKRLLQTYLYRESVEELYEC